MIFNKNFVLVLSFLTAQPLVFASAEKTFFTGENNPAIEKKFVRAFNAFKKTSVDYPTAEEAVKKMREIVSDLHAIDGPDADAVASELVVQYLDKYPKLLKKDVRIEVLDTLLRDNPEPQGEKADEVGLITEKVEQSQEEANNVEEIPEKSEEASEEEADSSANTNRIGKKTQEELNELSSKFEISNQVNEKIEPYSVEKKPDPVVSVKPSKPKSRRKTEAERLLS